MNECKDCRYWISLQDYHEDAQEEWEDGICKKSYHDDTANAFDGCMDFENGEPL